MSSYCLLRGLTSTSKSFTSLWEEEIWYSRPAPDQAASVADWIMAVCNNRPDVSVVQRGSVLRLRGLPPCTVVFWLSRRETQTWRLIAGLSKSLAYTSDSCWSWRWARGGSKHTCQCTATQRNNNECIFFVKVGEGRTDWSLGFRAVRYWHLVAEWDATDAALGCTCHGLWVCDVCGYAKKNASDFLFSLYLISRRGRILSTPRSTRGRNKEIPRKTDLTSTEWTGGEPFTSERACACVCVCVCVHVWHIPAWPSPSSSFPANNLPGGASTLPHASSSSLQSFLLLRGANPLSHSPQAGGTSITQTGPALPPPRCLLRSSLLSPSATHTQPYGHEPLLSLLSFPPSVTFTPFPLPIASDQRLCCLEETESSSASLFVTRTHAHTPRTRRV